MKYQLLAVDIDGTLVNSSGELTPTTRAALRRAVAAGVHVVLATGRRYGRVLHLVEPIGIAVPLVTASGALVKHPADHRTIFRAEFDEAVLGELLGFLLETGHPPVLSVDNYTEGFEFWCRVENLDEHDVAEFIARNPARVRIWAGAIDRIPPATFAGFVMASHDEMLDVERAIHARWPGRFATHVLRSPQYEGFLCEFMPAGTSKWWAIERLAADWGIGHDAICAVGDDVNDIQMIREAGLGVAMGNALPLVKAVADRIAPGHDQDGVATVVDWILE